MAFLFASAVAFFDSSEMHLKEQAQSVSTDSEKIYQNTR